MTHRLPHPVGPISRMARSALSNGRVGASNLPTDPFDRDTQLAWFMLNEASFAGWDDVDDGAEWSPRVVKLRQALETWFSSLIAERFDAVQDPQVAVDGFLALGGPSISQYLADHGTRPQVAESLMLRLPYQYKEADPHTFAIPRLDGPVKRALVEIQTGEYGVGHRSTHAELFRNAMVGIGITEDFTSVVEQLPGVAFATSNLVSMGGLNRSRRGVAIGQLALFEMDSVEPNGTMAVACDRLGLSDATRRFFDVHVMADAEHEVIAREAFLESYPLEEPGQVANLLFGVKAQHAIDVELADTAISAWSVGRSALVEHSSAAEAA